METKGSNQSLVKKTNQNLIIREIRQNKRLSRSDLAKKLQISNPSVSKHVDDLLSKGLLIETGSLVTDVGRRPIMLEFNGLRGCVAVVDLSSNDARICVADLLGNKLEYARVEGGRHLGLDNFDRIILTLRDMLNSLGDRCGGLVGICIGAPAAVEPGTGRLLWSSRIDDYQNFDLCEYFTRSLHAPVIIKNDINLAVVGERIFGAGGGHDSIMYLSIDAGVGLSGIINGKLYEGVHGLACDLGVVITDIDGVLNLGDDVSEYMPYCFERQFSVYGLVERVRDRLEQGRESVLREWVPDPAELTFDDVVRAYGMSDPMTSAVVRNFAKCIALLCRNLSSLFDVELILLGGMIAHLGKPLLTEIQDFYAVFPGYSKAELKIAKLFDSAVVFGGIDTATQYAIDLIIDE